MSVLKKINGKFCKVYQLEEYYDQLGNSCTLWTLEDRTTFYFGFWNGFEDELTKMRSSDPDAARKEFQIKCYESGGEDLLLQGRLLLPVEYVSAFPIVRTDDDFHLYQEYGTNNFYIRDGWGAYKISPTTYDEALNYFLDAYYVELIKKYGELDHVPMLYSKGELKGYAQEESL